MVPINRYFVILVVAMITCVASAQSHPDIVKSINNGGNVNVTLPDGLTDRSNSSLGKSSNVKSDDDEGAQPVKSEVKNTDSGKRPSNISQQTVQGRKVGFRIQVYSDNSSNGKANAQARAKALSVKFPQYRTYLSYNAPSWRLRIGDFKDHSEASAALGKVRGAFPAYSSEMIVVKDNVNVWSK